MSNSIEECADGKETSRSSNKECYINRVTVAIICVVFAVCATAAGLLAYYYTAENSSLENLQKEATPLLRNDNIAVSKATSTNTSVNIRLPTSIKPIHYLVQLQPFINGNFSILGYVEIEMLVEVATSNVTLHIADIITKNETVKIAPIEDLQGPGISILSHQYDSEREFYIATLDQDLEAGKTYVLLMEFEGLLNDQLRGFYRSSYIDENGNEKLLATTHFHPTNARRAFPCFDEPSFKAEFTIKMVREINLTSISNMPSNYSESVPDQSGWMQDTFARSVPMSTYLVAFVVSDFVFVNSTTENGILFRIWARPQAIGQAEYASELGPDILTFYENYFSVPYPLPKQDMIAIPDFALGAMENWGLITYRETSLLYDPQISTASNKQRVAVVIAHELAHQWFGNLVTPEWWTDSWLNEGFATYMENIGANHSEPTFQMLEQFISEDLQPVMESDALESSHPISIEVQHPDEINDVFDSISYQKGASIIRMMNHFLTEATFRSALTNYLNDFKYDTVVQDDLWECLTNQAHQDGTLPIFYNVKEIMDTWTLQMGFPLLNVTINGNGTATVVQSRFLLAKSENSTDTHDYKWWIPINFVAEGNPDFSSTTPVEWMRDRDTEITVTGLPSTNEWIIFNTQETGYYRVNYDVSNWNKIINQLKTNHQIIHIANRAQVIDDSLDIARGGIAKGQEQHWNFAWNQYLSSNVASEKVLLLNALGCTTEIWILSSYGYSSILGDLCNIASKEFNTENELAELEQFKADHEQEFGSSTRSVEQAIDRTSVNIKWMSANYDDIYQWLVDHGHGNLTT